MKEAALALALVLFSDVVVPRVAQWTAPPEPEAEEEESEESPELERLRAENALLKDIVVEKELALRAAAQEGEEESEEG